MARRVLLLLALGTVASCVEDSENLVQRALTVSKPKRAAPEEDWGPFDKKDAKKKTGKEGGGEKQTPEEKKAEPLTRKMLKEAISNACKEIKGFPTLFIGALQEAIVPKIMDSRRKSTSVQRRLMDGFIQMDMTAFAKATNSEKIEKVEGALKHAGLEDAAVMLYNASVILPPVLANAPELANITAVAAKELIARLEPAVKKFVEEFKPYAQKLSGDVQNVTRDHMEEFKPFMLEAAGPTKDVVNNTVMGLIKDWNTDVEFTPLRTTLKDMFGVTL